MQNCKEILILQELLLSDSDSDSSDDESNVIINFISKNIPCKIENFVGIIMEMKEAQFKENFRMVKEICMNLIEDFKNSYHNPTIYGHPGLQNKSPETHILSFIWYAANKSTMREISIFFNLSQSTFEKCMDRVLDFFKDIAPLIIKFPTTENEKILTSEKFEQLAGFKNVIGCIDGSYIPIKTPAHKIKNTYTNRHHHISFTLQGICDANKVFTNVFIGAPSKIHDSRVYTLSNISDTLFEICDTRYHLLGDSAYPIREWLLTPHRNYGNLTHQQIVYNNKLSTTRVVIENAFGMLKSRFRQPLKLELWNVEKLSKFVLACCVMHNICINNGDIINVEEEFSIENSPELEYDNQNQNILRIRGENKRAQITSEF